MEAQPLDAIERVIGDYESHVARILGNLNDVGVQVTEMEMDHIAYRATSDSAYHAVKGRLSPFGRWVSEAMVRGRPIALIVLDEPLEVREFRIPVIEVIAPKAGDRYAEGLEHVEFVYNGPLRTLVELYPDVPFQLDAMARASNPELKLKFGGANVKFHQCTVLDAALMQATTGEL